MTHAIARTICVGVSLLALLGCRREHPTPPTLATADASTIVLVARTPDLATFPCAEGCHVRRASNPTPRPLREFHVGREVHHGPTIHWCDFCHRLDGLNELRLIDRTSVSFDESHRLCGQCHSARLHDWELGIHGLQTGSWAGERRRRTCTACHDPHDPHRPAFQALPPPMRDRSFPVEQNRE